MVECPTKYMNIEKNDDFFTTSIFMLKMDLLYAFTSGILSKDIIGHILTFIPYEYKNALNSVIEDKFVEKHIHHYEPHMFVWEEYHRITRIKRMEKQYVNGVLNGLYLTWWDDSELRERGIYVNGEKEGKWQQFVYGNLTETFYKNGKEDGVTKYWDPSGTLDREETYKDGMKHGITINWLTFNCNILKEEEEYEEGAYVLYKSFYKNGQLAISMQYQNGRRHGLFKEYYQDGELYAVREFSEGQCVKTKFIGEARMNDDMTLLLTMRQKFF